ncbi:TRAP transporter small permease subunit [Novosphingobium sp.]|uniref:TRAP transporter small permease n=1 Tax=Novosphingobium sp. TaxID=1874826 RepID=UPI0025CC384D|nr:TRAP transporter small permease subunit [Novosphingobium sp.]
MTAPLTRIGVWLGGSALVAATSINVGAVIGRRIGLPLHGAIELVQVCVLVAGTIALVRATALLAHARIHLLLDRLPPPRRELADRLSALAGMLFFVALLAGSGWIQADLWNAHETSEVIGVPWRLLRLVANSGLVLIAALFALQALRGRR